jgi:hypothetical protein
MGRAIQRGEGGVLPDCGEVQATQDIGNGFEERGQSAADEAEQQQGTLAPAHMTDGHAEHDQHRYARNDREEQLCGGRHCRARDIWYVLAHRTLL